LLLYLVSVLHPSKLPLNSRQVRRLLEQRRVWAEEDGLNADAIEKMYRDLVNHFIDEEMKHWKQSKID
jgi:isochorismate pyruvate lyase